MTEETKKYWADMTAYIEKLSKKKILESIESNKCDIITFQKQVSIFEKELMQPNRPLDDIKVLKRLIKRYKKIMIDDRKYISLAQKVLTKRALAKKIK